MWALIIDLYRDYIFYVLVLLVFASLLLLWVSRKSLKPPFRKIRKKHWIYLILIFALGFVLRIFVFPHHHLWFVDEPLYLEAAKNLAEPREPLDCSYISSESLDCMMYTKPVFWPFLLSLIFTVFGPSNILPMYFTSVVGSLLAVLVFLLSYLMFKDARIGLVSGFLIAVNPDYILWSTSALSDMASVFVAVLAFVILFLYIETKKPRLIYLSVALLVIAVLTRVELIVLVPLVAILLLLHRHRVQDKRVVLTAALAFTMFMLVYLVQFLLMLGFVVGIPTESMAEGLVEHNTVTQYTLRIPLSLVKNTAEWLGYLKANAALFVFSLIGVVCSLKKERKHFAFLGAWFLLFFIVYTAYWRLETSRFLLMPMLPLLLFAAYGIHSLIQYKRVNKHQRMALSVILALIFALSVPQYISHIRFANNPYSTLKTQYPKILDQALPDGCAVITEYPVELTSVPNIKPVKTSYILENPENIKRFDPECIAFLRDDYCFTERKNQPRGVAERCQYIGEHFNLEPLITDMGGIKGFDLHRLVLE